MVSKDIEIFPIFNQAAAGVWDDFLRIRAAAMKHNYRLDMSPSELSSARTELLTEWERLSHNFAFGAYDGQQMVGCLNGDCRSGVATIQHLYIMPEYQKQRLGTRLLRAAENAMTIYARRTELVSLGYSCEFYEHNGYSLRTGNTRYEKQLKRTGFACPVPLFYCTPEFVRMVGGFADKNNFNAADVNRMHSPAYAFRDTEAQIAGFGTLTPTEMTPVVYVSPKNGDMFVERSLGTAMRRFADFANSGKVR